MGTIALFLVATLLAGCATAGAPSMTEDARCQLHGGIWRVSYCDTGGAGGGGY